MKKVYLEDKWKKHSKNISKRELLKKQKRLRGYRKRHEVPSHYKGRSILKRGGKAILTAPENFSLLNNVEETLEFFDVVTKYITENKNIYLDIANVKNITTDSILYMLSNIEYCRTLHRRANISGNAPSDAKCNEIFLSSGFYKFVYAKDPGIIRSVNKNIYSIESGHHTLVDKAEGVIYFTNKRLGRELASNSTVTYPILIECMTNTHNHAYNETFGLYNKWWLMASYDADLSRVHFVFLDNGLGIPKTIRKNFKERVIELFGNLVLKNAVDDVGLICSALRGEFRTRTGDSYRGKGLQKIYDSMRANSINDPTIISRRGYVNCSSLSGTELNKTFHGTLYSWFYV